MSGVLGDCEKVDDLRDKHFDVLFTKDRPIIFACHRCPRHTHHLHVCAFEEEGATSPPFDMVVMSDLDRLHLVGDAIDRVPGLGAKSACPKQALFDDPIDRAHNILEYGEAIPEITGWKWGQKGAKKKAADTGMTMRDGVRGTWGAWRGRL